MKAINIHIKIKGTGSIMVIVEGKENWELSSNTGRSSLYFS